MDAPLKVRSCLACQRDLGDSINVCRHCGAIQRKPESVDEERAVLHEWRALLNSQIPTDGSAPNEVFVRNGLIPNDTEVLFEETLYAIKLLHESLTAPALPRARFEALMAALELKALGEPTVARRLPMLRKQADLARRESVAIGREIALVLLLGAGLLAGLIWLVSRLFGS